MESPSLTPAFRGKVNKQSGMFVTVRRNVQLLTGICMGLEALPERFNAGVCLDGLEETLNSFSGDTVFG